MSKRITPATDAILLLSDGTVKLLHGIAIGDDGASFINRLIDIDGTLETTDGAGYGIASTPSAGATVTDWMYAYAGRADVEATTTLINSVVYMAVNPVVSGVLNTAVAFYASDITNGGVNNYAIYTNLGDVRLGDEVVIACATASALTIGAGTAGIDYILKFDGQTNDGQITWMEDEDYFDFADTIKSSAGRIVNTTRLVVGDSPYTTVNADHIIFADTDGGAITVNLQAGVEGRYLRIINCGSSGNDVTIEGDGAEEVRQAANQTIADGEILILVYNSTEGWF